MVCPKLGPQIPCGRGNHDKPRAFRDTRYINYIYIHIFRQTQIDFYKSWLDILSISQGTPYVFHKSCHESPCSHLTQTLSPQALKGCAWARLPGGFDQRGELMEKWWKLRDTNQ